MDSFDKARQLERNVRLAKADLAIADEALREARFDLKRAERNVRMQTARVSLHERTANAFARAQVQAIDPVSGIWADPPEFDDDVYDLDEDDYSPLEPCVCVDCASERARAAGQPTPGSYAQARAQAGLRPA